MNLTREADNRCVSHAPSPNLLANRTQCIYNVAEGIKGDKLISPSFFFQYQPFCLDEIIGPGHKTGRGILAKHGRYSYKVPALQPICLY